MIVVAAGAGAFLYYNKQQTNHRRAGRASSGSEQTQVPRRRNESKAKRKEKTTSNSDQAMSDAAEVGSTSVPVSSANNIQKRKGGKKPVNGAAKSSAVDVAPKTIPVQDVDHDGDDTVDNKEFARQMAGAKKGFSLATPAKSSQSKQSNKLGKASRVRFNADEDVSATSSTTGADADDDLSVSNSPALDAAPDHTGVSDMLEAPGRGPSVLRLTESTQPPKPNQPKLTKPAQAPETKKQRQNRRRNEERKLEREQTEKERRVLLEKQLRTAREAEGRPAKNGVPISKPPTSSAWAKQSRDSSASNPVQAVAAKGPLLDTFEETKASETATSNGYSTKVAGRDENTWEHDLPSEEEQLRLLNEINNDGWQTVEKPKKRDKLATAISTDEDKPSTQRPASRAAAISQVANEDSGKVDEYGYKNGRYLPYAETGHPDDSDWPVA